jgi:tRNA modification GTPase
VSGHRVVMLTFVCNAVRVVAFSLAMQELGKITGRVDVEELLDIIFRDFCIGK